MNFIRIIIFLAVITPFMSVLSGCYNDALLDAVKEEEDFIAPFDVEVAESDSWRTSYFTISDTGRTGAVLDGDDASFINMPHERNFSERHIVNGGSNGDDTDTDDVVDDNVTGLTWLKCTVMNRNLADNKDDCSGANNTLSWSHANETCANLDYAGYDDWRVPTITELFTILDFDHWPLIDTAEFFIDNESAAYMGYWSSTSKLFVEFNSNYESYDVNDYAWIIYFGGGGVWGVNIVDLKEKIVYDEDTGTTTIEKQFVRCVRGRR
jgi:hypothetical protein